MHTWHAIEGAMLSRKLKLVALILIGIRIGWLAKISPDSPEQSFALYT